MPVTELLEDRLMLATYIVMRAGDNSNGNYEPEDLTIREAIELANANPGHDTILMRTSTGGISVSSPLPAITDDLTITTDLLGRYFVFIGAGSAPAFEVVSGVTLQLSRFEMTGPADIVNNGTLYLDTMQTKGIDNSGSLIISNSYLTGVETSGPDPSIRHGAALFMESGTLFVANSTISDAASGGSGGAFYITGGTATIVTSTFTNNRSQSIGTEYPGGGIFIGAGADVTIHNSIVAGNLGDPSDIAGTLKPASSYNIIGDANAAGGLVHGVNGNIVGNNGTGVLDINTILNTELSYNDPTSVTIRTKTHALVPGSPALDSGWIPLAKDANGNHLINDQRAFARVSGKGLDRGAYELQVNTRQDVVSFNHNTGYWWLGFSNGGTFSNTQGPRWSLDFPWQILTGDFNGDGLTDGLGRQLASGQWWAALANGTTLTNLAFGKWAPDVNAYVQGGDFNGDGKDDVVGIDATGRWHIGTSDGTRFNTLPTINWSPTGWASIQVADLNGDGKDDLIGMHQASGNWWAAMSTGSGFQSVSLGKWNATFGWQNFRVGDFTGDGADDVLLQSAEGYWFIGTLVGNKLQPIEAGRSVISTASPTVADFNGDGLADLAVTNAANQVFLKLGTGGALSTPIFSGTAPTNRVLATSADVDANGRKDLVYFAPNSGGWISLLSSGVMFTPKSFGTWTAASIAGFQLKFFGHDFGGA